MLYFEIKTLFLRCKKRDTIKQYIDYLKDSFLIEEALRYDVKG